MADWSSPEAKLLIEPYGIEICYPMTQISKPLPF